MTDPTAVTPTTAKVVKANPTLFLPAAFLVGAAAGVLLGAKLARAKPHDCPSCEERKAKDLAEARIIVERANEAKHAAKAYPAGYFDPPAGSLIKEVSDSFTAPDPTDIGFIPEGKLVVNGQVFEDPTLP